MMSHELPRGKSFWSFLLSVDRDLAKQLGNTVGVAVAAQPNSTEPSWLSGRIAGVV